MQSISGWLMTKIDQSDGDGEIALLRAGQAGDTVALERLFAPYERSLLRLCRGMLEHREDAEDAVQETFLRALNSLTGFRGASGFRTWLFRIAINVCLDRKSRPKHTTLSPHCANNAQSDSPEAVVVRQLQIAAALRTLPPRRHALLLLKEVEGWSIAEIASAMQCSTKQVHNELYQARWTLAEWRQREAQEENK